MCLLPCFPPTTNTCFSNQQLEKQKLPVKVKHDMQKASYLFFFYANSEKYHPLDPGIKQISLSPLLSDKMLLTETTKDKDTIFGFLLKGTMTSPSCPEWKVPQAIPSHALLLPHHQSHEELRNLPKRQGRETCCLHNAQKHLWLL